jgi:LysR family transcriptional regulator of gallate degradation
MSHRESPTRAIFEAALQENGHEPPHYSIQTSSLLITRGILEGTDMITVLSAHQIHYEQRLNLLTTLDLPLFDQTRPIGVIRRSQGSIPPAAEAMLDAIRDVANDIGPKI